MEWNLKSFWAIHIFHVVDGAPVDAAPSVLYAFEEFQNNAFE